MVVPQGVGQAGLADLLEQKLSVSLNRCALYTALLATTHAEAGDLDTACELGRQAINLASGIQSRRVQQRFAQLNARLIPHRSVPSVTAFLEQLRDLPATA